GGLRRRLPGSALRAAPRRQLLHQAVPLPGRAVGVLARSGTAEEHADQETAQALHAVLLRPHGDRRPAPHDPAVRRLRARPVLLLQRGTRRRDHRRVAARSEAARGGAGSRSHLRLRHAPGGASPRRPRVPVHCPVARLVRPTPSPRPATPSPRPATPPLCAATPLPCAATPHLARPAPSPCAGRTLHPLRSAPAPGTCAPAPQGPHLRPGAACTRCGAACTSRRGTGCTSRRGAACTSRRGTGCTSRRGAACTSRRSTARTSRRGAA